MKEQIFFLQPFQKDVMSYPFNIKGNIARNFDSFYIRYEFLGDLSEILIPEKADIPARKNNLWQNTCLEFFIALRELPQYWEFNLSTSGDWNVYSFTDYRNGMKEELSFASLPFKIKKQTESFQLDFECDLGKIINKSQPAEFGVCTVIKYKNRELGYWALMHCDDKPDFHLRDSFILKL